MLQIENLSFSLSTFNKVNVQRLSTYDTQQSQTLLSQGDFDHLKSNNLSLLSSLASSTSTSTLPIYSFTKSSSNLSSLTSNLSFKNTL